MDIYDLEVGTLVDFVVAYTNMQESAEDGKKDGKRKATQKDIDAFFNR